MAENKKFIAKNGLDNNSKIISNVLSPTTDSDAANKAYVDSADQAINQSITSHITDATNPHDVTATQVGAIESSIGISKGDIIAFSASNTPTRVQLGSNNQVLHVNTATSTGVEWVNLDDVVYTLPVATETTLGGVKEGANVDISAAGVLSLSEDIDITSVTADSVSVGGTHKQEVVSGYTVFRYIGA